MRSVVDLLGILLLVLGLSAAGSAAVVGLYLLVMALLGVTT